MAILGAVPATGVFDRRLDLDTLLLLSLLSGQPFGGNLLTLFILLDLLDRRKDVVSVRRVRQICCDDD